MPPKKNIEYDPQFANGFTADQINLIFSTTKFVPDKAKVNSVLQELGTYIEPYKESELKFFYDREFVSIILTGQAHYSLIKLKNVIKIFEENNDFLKKHDYFFRQSTLSYLLQSKESNINTAFSYLKEIIAEKNRKLSKILADEECADLLGQMIRKSYTIASKISFEHIINLIFENKDFSRLFPNLEIDKIMTVGALEKALAVAKEQDLLPPAPTMIAASPATTRQDSPPPAPAITAPEPTPRRVEIQRPIPIRPSLEKRSSAQPPTKIQRIRDKSGAAAALTEALREANEL